MELLMKSLTLFAALGQASSQLDIWELVSQSTGAVMAVLVLLVMMSLVSWYIIASKALYLRKARKESERFQDLFWKSKRLDATYKEAELLRKSPTAQLFRAGYIELTKLKGRDKEKERESDAMELSGFENVERAMHRASVAEATELEKNLSFLATTGSTAPFIGLFGTVWGIMHAFINLSANTGDLGIQSVAGPIAEALIATAIGLLAAIPSVMAYNYFGQKLKVLSADMESFSNDFLNIVKRNFFK
jgi:biopolymer transport protein TolQ